MKTGKEIYCEVAGKKFNAVEYQQWVDAMAKRFTAETGKDSYIMWYDFGNWIELKHSLGELIKN